MIRNWNDFSCNNWMLIFKAWKNALKEFKRFKICFKNNKYAFTSSFCIISNQTNKSSAGFEFSLIAISFENSSQASQNSKSLSIHEWRESHCILDNFRILWFVSWKHSTFIKNSRSLLLIKFTIFFTNSSQ